MNIASLRRAGILVVAITTALIASSCDNSYGFISSVQQESLATQKSTFYKAAVNQLVAYSGDYYARLVGIYKRPAASAASKDWTLVDTIGSLGDAYTCRGLAATTAGLYAAILSRVDGTETPVGIYHFDGTSWTLAMSSATADIQALYAANNEVFALVRTSYTSSTAHYAIRHLNGAALETTGIDDVTTYPAGLVGNGSGQYWAAAGVTLYLGSSPTGLASSAVTIAKTASALTYDSAASTLFLGTKDGYVYNWDGTTASPTGGYLATTSTSYGITTLAALPRSAGAYCVLAGNSLQGYFESPVSTGQVSGFTIGSDSLYVASATNYDTSLQYLPVYSFDYVGDSTSGTLFASASSTMSTSYPGLWSNAYSGGAWSGWTAE